MQAVHDAVDTPPTRTVVQAVHLAGQATQILFITV